MKRATVADMAIHPLRSADLGAAPSYQDSVIAPTPADSAPDLDSPARRAPSSELAQFILRMPREQRRRLHELAFELEISAQELFFTALDEFLERKGLLPIR